MEGEGEEEAVVESEREEQLADCDVGLSVAEVGIQPCIEINSIVSLKNGGSEK